MSYSSEEIYREKYLKYKKKYITALENMKGGLENQPITKDSTIYFCPEGIYNDIKRNVTDVKFNGITNCFIEKLNTKFNGPSLVLANTGLFGGFSLKTTMGKEVEKVPNYPFLSGRQFGINERKGTQEFDQTWAMEQLKDQVPFLKFNLRKNNSNNSNSDVYMIHVDKNKKISFNGVLEHTPLTTLESAIESLPSLKGGGKAMFYFCNPASSLSVNKQYGIPDKPIKVTKCFTQTLEDKLEDTSEPRYGTLEELSKEIVVKNGDSITKIDTKKFGDTGESILGKFSYKTANDELKGNKEKLKSYLKVENIDEITVYRLDGDSLQLFENFVMDEDIKEAEVKRKEEEAKRKEEEERRRKEEERRRKEEERRRKEEERNKK